MLAHKMKDSRCSRQVLALILSVAVGVSTALADDKPMTNMPSGTASQAADKPMPDTKSNVATPQAGEKPMKDMKSVSPAPKTTDRAMAGMKSGSAVSHAASMTEMMGAPGLIPFEIMSGQSGKWMVGYQFMYERLDGNQDGTKNVDEAQILEQFAAAPTGMTMRMHMGMVMYAPTDKLTLMAMLPYESMSMGELHRDGTHSTETSAGLGDLEVRGLYTVHAGKTLRHRVLAGFGVGVPTGSISQRDSEGERMEYPMQTGSGTYAFLPGLTYLGQALPWGWAADINSTLRFGQNDVGYRLGNRYQSSVSVARQFNGSVSASLGIRGEWWNNIHGADPLLDPTSEPTKDPNLQGGKRLSALFGVTIHPQSGILAGQHFHTLVDLPIMQSLDGPQLKKKWGVRVGWQLEF